ncbi:restriction endonuclease subunit S [Phocaeicola barnesiae]|uniref:restriction endonuclease subunit S n=1 Tax=Phocaeicola barnesiae TaxID=376804 RepID=UPI0025A43B6F|nr:restriction endonuclease subunit S [Phocaeicola barnesiae]MDM8252719.1 restriction endonuclease subunit S [Phocaeicola barnesiae]
MNIPKIRFKGFEDTWKNDIIGNIGSVLMCKRIFKSQTTSIGDIPFYKIGTFGSTADAFISENLFNEYKTRFSYPQYGDILLSAAGTIGRIVEYKGEKAYFQDSNIVWVKVNGKIKNQFLKYIYSCIKWNGLEGSTIKRLYNNNILETAINYPSPEEQQKIASYFQSLDSLIQITSKKLASLKQIKAASLQSMFPREGETVPKVRFKGFEERWLLMKINDVCKQSTSRLSENSLGPNAGNYAVYGANGYLQNITTYDYDCPYIGIIKDGSGAGRSRLYPKYSSIIGTMQYIIPKETINIEFLAYLFETINFTKFIIGSSIPHIYYKNYCENIVPIPSYNEQQKIGAYFRNLDRQISLQTQRLEKLKQIKAACLDKMFV